MVHNSQQQDYADFLRRFEADPASISGEEVARRYHELMSLASPEQAAEAQNQAFALLAPESRRTVAQQLQEAHNDPNSTFDGYRFDDADQAAQPRNLGLMALQAEQQDQSALSRFFNSPLGRMVMTAIVAYLARRMFGGQQSQQTGPGQQAGGQGGLDLGAILGALASAQGGGAQGGGQGLPGGLDLGAILGALTGAQGGRQSGGGQASPGGLDIGDLLGARGAAQGGGQEARQVGDAPVSGQPDLSDLLREKGDTQAESSDLGSILTSLGGGQRANIAPSKQEDEQEDKQS
jgi:hypothetical protein